MTSSRHAAGATDPETLDMFVALHYGRLVRLAGLVCLDRADAQDAVQNGLLRAWRNRGQIRDPARMKAWVDAIVVREAIRLNGRARSILRLLSGRLAAPDQLRDPSAHFAVHELAAMLRSLPVPQRAAVALHYDAGYTVAETAELLGVPVETVRSRLRLARQRLRRDFGEEDR
jgi:RNA polymerase sigma-70 factor, ECF subfamily